MERWNYIHKVVFRVAKLLNDCCQFAGCNSSGHVTCSFHSDGTPEQCNRAVCIRVDQNKTNRLSPHVVYTLIDFDHTRYVGRTVQECKQFFKKNCLTHVRPRLLYIFCQKLYQFVKQTCPVTTALCCLISRKSSACSLQHGGCARDLRSTSGCPCSPVLDVACKRPGPT